MEITLTHNNFLAILQLASPALPVGAYGYSEGLEILVENGTITNIENLKFWLKSELIYGTIRLDAGIIIRAFHATKNDDFQALKHWNLWLSAARDTEELRAASWQMGRSLIQLLSKLKPEILPLVNAVGYPSNYAIA
ncbi:MAG: urease accessory protein UreF, partial [Dolichospermum sp.]